MKKRAFSLIELSIVLLIIGIIVAGITQSSRLVASYRLSTARSITQSSPVPSISGLVLWLDATAEGAIAEAQAEDGADVTSWTEVNPQVSSQKSVAEATAPPSYDADGINEIPALQFVAADTEFLDMAAVDAEVNPTKFTVFAVVKPTTVSAAMTILSVADVSANTGFSVTSTTGPDYSVNVGDASAYSANTTTSLPTSAANTTAVVVGQYDGTNLSIYMNSATASDTDADAYTVQAAEVLKIGVNDDGAAGLENYFNGHIGEIVMYNQSLTTEERTSVVNYLKKKWGVN